MKWFEDEPCILSFGDASKATVDGNTVRNRTILGMAPSCRGCRIALVFGIATIPAPGLAGTSGKVRHTTPVPAISRTVPITPTPSRQTHPLRNGNHQPRATSVVLWALGVTLTRRQRTGTNPASFTPATSRSTHTQRATVLSFFCVIEAMCARTLIVDSTRQSLQHRNFQVVCYNDLVFDDLHRSVAHHPLYWLNDYQYIPGCTSANRIATTRNRHHQSAPEKPMVRYHTNCLYPRLDTSLVLQQ
jgi:hypothetical protein